MVTKQDVEILFAGAAITAGIDGAIETVWASDTAKWSGKFPYVPTIDPLPPVDDWIVLGIPTAITLAGHFAKKEKVRNFGLGGLLYAVPMFMHHIIIRSAAAAGLKFSSNRYATVPIAPIKEI